MDRIITKIYLSFPSPSPQMERTIYGLHWVKTQQRNKPNFIYFFPPDGHAPPDSIVEVVVPIVISLTLFIGMTVLASMGIVLTCLFLVFNIRYRRAKWVSKMQTLEWRHITVTSWWARWRLKSPASRSFTQRFIRAQINRSKKILKLRVTGLCAEISPVTGEFPAQMASYTENVSIWWRHHVSMKTSQITGNWLVC